MGRVMRYFEGIMAPIACVSITQYVRCSQEPVCRFRRILLDIRNYCTRLLDRASLAEVCAGVPVTAQEVFAPEFADGLGI